VSLIRGLMDDVDVEKGGGGTTVTMRRRLRGEIAEA
jgi:anti-sigma regulatory factor (Ser/Thr protein kinase)